MLKRALFTTTALAALTASALAADLPSRRAPPPIVAVPVFTWSGFYIGGNAGYAFSTQRSEITTGLSAFNEAIVAGGGRPRFARLDQEGFTGGGQIGYNYQIGALVIGLEADAAYTDLAARRAIVTAGAVNTYRQDLNFLGTVRGRVGYAFDRLMIYGTGGLAYGDVDTRATFFSGPTQASAPAFIGGRAGIDIGWTAGAGVEYALPTSFSLFNSNAITLKAEALYYDLGSRNVGITNTAAGIGPGYRANFETNGVIARAGINFKFGTF